MPSHSPHRESVNYFLNHKIMKEIALNTLLTDLEPLMLKVKVVTGGYLTEVQTLMCERLERLGVATGNQPLEFYCTEQDHVLAFHFARRLDLQKSICAIDYFPQHSPKEVSKVSDKLLEVLRKPPVFTKKASKHHS